MTKKLGRQTSLEAEQDVPAYEALLTFRQRQKPGQIFSRNDILTGMMSTGEHDPEQVFKTFENSLGYDIVILGPDEHTFLVDGNIIRGLPTSKQVAESWLKNNPCDHKPHGDWEARHHGWFPYESVEGIVFHTDRKTEHKLKLGHNKIVFKAAPAWLLHDGLAGSIIRIFHDHPTTHIHNTTQNLLADKNVDNDVMNSIKTLLEDAKTEWEDMDSTTQKRLTLAGFVTPTRIETRIEEVVQSVKDNNKKQSRGKRRV